MVGKSSVSALEEFCAKIKISAPTYEFANSEDGSFMCEVTVLDTLAAANGRSKRDAKHLAAANIIHALRPKYPKLLDVSTSSLENIPATDLVVALRDYCVQNQHPLPLFEIIQQAGSPDAPEFTCVCQVASIKRYGTSDKKKDARQKAALEMLRIIVDDCQPDHQLQVTTLQNQAKVDVEERYKKFKTYRELTESKNGEVSGSLLCDRHDFFKKFYKPLKMAAFAVMQNEDLSEHEKAFAVLDALKLKPKISALQTTTSLEPHLLIELDCEYDILFAGPKTGENNIYKSIVDYFRIMLK